jgi:hypothetical protein
MAEPLTRPLAVTPKQTTVYVVSREVPVYDYDPRPDGKGWEPRQTGWKVQRRTCHRRWDAYRKLAHWMIQAKRERFQHGNGPPYQCTLCDAAQEAAPGYNSYGEPNDPAFCRYHDDRSFHHLAYRLARWLRWRDEWRAAHPMAMRRWHRQQEVTR